MELDVSPGSHRGAKQAFSPIELYLDLLKKSLTGPLFKAEPDVDQAELSRTVLHVQHYVEGFGILALTHASAFLYWQF